MANGYPAGQNGGTKSAWRSEVTFVLNGQRVSSKDVQPQQTALSFLRERMGLTGTKLGCGEGGCGACTISVAKPDANGELKPYQAVNACLAPICSLDGCSVLTVEGIGCSRAPHPVQERISAMHGSQCGFCTPGIVMSLFSTLAKNPKPTLMQIESSFDGNLCRCTGYRPILDAAKTFAVDPENCPDVPTGYEKGSCQSAEKEGNALVCSSTKTVLEAMKAVTNGTAPPVPELSEKMKTLLKDLNTKPALRVEGDRVMWLAPSSLEALLEAKSEHPQAKVVAGNTEVGIETKFKNQEYPVILCPSRVPELLDVSFDETGTLHVGGAVTLSTLEHTLDKALSKNCSNQTSRLTAMVEMLRWFASTQIRNVAVLSGNLVTASPISDMNPVLMTLDATAVLVSKGGATREISVKEFFLKYRTVNMKPEEVVLKIKIPPTKSQFEVVKSYKQARRRDDDISIVNSCLRVELEPSKDAWTIKECHASFGGMAPTTSRAKNLETALTGATWNETVLQTAYDALSKDFTLPESVPGGMAAYRQTLASSFFFKFFISTNVEVAEKANKLGNLPALPKIDERELSGASTFLSQDRPLTSGSHRFHVPSGGLQVTSVASKHEVDHEPMPAEPGAEKRAPVGQPLRHVAALVQCTGEAQYTDDIPSARDTLHAAFVLSERAHAKILSIDTSEAEKLESVSGFFCAKDLPETRNECGPVKHDEQLFRRDTVTSVGQPVGMIVATSIEEAQKAARLVKVTYEDLEPPIITIEDAIKHNSYLGNTLDITCGDDVDAVLKRDGLVVVEGEFKMGGQEHFYLETCCAVATPGERDEITIFTSTQNPTETQKYAAIACGVPQSKVVCRMKRMGGGFGGKETRTVFISSAVAFAAHSLGRPVRINVERDVDMLTTGTRHPFIGKYRAAADKDGKLQALDINFYCNAGFSQDLSEAVLGRALFHADSCYKFPNVRVVGKMCKTNTVSNTAYRGFGGPQGLILGEAVLEHLAAKLNVSSNELRTKNMYNYEGDVTHFFQKLEHCPLQRMWKDLYESSDFQKRELAAQDFNKANRWRKRGIAMFPTKFGISFTAKFMNQGAALVHIYTDGTVLVSHGGTEMGQGLHTKILQVAARALGIPVADVHIRETATDAVANTSPTAASASSDLYGMAVLNACEQLNKRLEPYMKAANGVFKKAVNSAFFDRCDLTAHGHYKTPGIGYNWFESDCSKRGKPFNYFTYGAACSEVEIDVLTGDMRILRADVLMDLGNSLNPAIDVGQIEGAFTQGVGWSTIEETVWGCDEFPWLKPGNCFTRGPGTYKIPAFNDVPIDMRISLLRDSENPMAIHSSRAVGEPPFFLGATAFFAARQAIAAARADAGLQGHFTVDSPLTAERIRMACGDEVASKFLQNCSRPRPSGFW
mmetsp:Transcript_75814/g.158036  ORF Transcript_75814/g.158036 Transcript_75814/m.158036 type:complete len:1399 (+) Transcript_75814:266-4462(+)|eukprot:CAMPEP_0206457996 /NCGR_PEP_ID=MMETSP0324_2-20121206/23296_1 /ASSEMBLY_ACC=CAM_ASM_000836 /TAXON_ID=2866 /ORGANISM="Crypthecodinium cohnii, Strain Seligo" /LENGTH=1398 /DNA_ID=CAMNT_0053929229 /DNA_START=425 /DNA_END=4621 /DNA_ORIENTATION=+